MYPEALLTSIVTSSDPLEPILKWIVDQFQQFIDLENISGSFERFEEELMEFERWIHDVWGEDFYRMLIGNDKNYAIPKAFKLADERNGNLILCDGFSLRELMVLRKAFPNRTCYKVGRAPVPTTTENVAKIIFQSHGLKEAITGSKLYWGKEWRGEVIEDITKPPRTGGQNGLMFLTYYPDAPLHHAMSYGTAFVQDVSNVMRHIITLVSNLSKNTPLVLTGDHGYIYLGDNPNKYMWMPSRRQQRFGEDYNSNYLEIEGVKVAVGRYHTPVSSRSDAVITHGGISLSESLVPVVIVDAENK